MACTVLKFGGTSVADPERIAHVAELVSFRAKAGEKLAVIVSAMAGETNRLVAFAEAARDGALHGESFEDEYDTVVASGEQVTSGLLALALRRRGHKARSWLGWQMGMQTRGGHAAARIDSFDENSGLKTSINAGEIAVIAGFQGITPQNRISTLGRGGSDTTAVAVAAALNADQCDIYTDVDGVYTTDPRIVPQARKIAKISYEEMLEMASLGAKVLQTRSVELAKNHGVRLRVLSSLKGIDDTSNNGTWVCSEEEIVEKQIVNGIAYSRDEAKITLLGMPDKPGTSARLFTLLAREGVNVDMIVQANARGVDRANMVFTCSSADSEKARRALTAHQAEIGFEQMDVEGDVAKVSVVGVGMKSHVGVAETMFEALSAKAINIDVISTSEIKISVLIDRDYTELAVRALHTAFRLDALPNTM